jgi:hypothetical protein
VSEPIRYTGKLPCEAGDSSLGSPHWEHPEGEWVKYEDYARLQAELKFSEHRMISLAEALADTRLGYQKEIEILKKGHTNPKRDQEALKKADKGKPSRPGVDGKIVRHKPRKGRGTY